MITSHMDKKEAINLVKSIAKVSRGVGNEILLGLDEYSMFVRRSRSISLACNPFSAEILREIDEAKERRRVKDALRSLEKRKLIQTVKKGNNIFKVLTAQGEMEVLRHKIRTNKKEFSDGQICIVMFDIPEDIREVRRQFNQFLKSCRFENIQKSVFSTKYDIVSDLKDLITRMNVSGWVSVFVSRHVA